MAKLTKMMHAIASGSKILMGLMLLLVSISLISASFEFDNIKSYDYEKREITFTNTIAGIPFLPLGDIATATLDTNQIEYVIPDNGIGEGRRVFQITFNSYSDYTDFIKNTKTIDLNTGKEIQREITYKYATYKDNYVNVPDTYKEVCIDLKINETNKEEGKSCSQIVDTWKKVNQPITEWIPLEKLDIKAEKLTIAGFAHVYSGDNIEWGMDLFGVNVMDTWAVWTDGLNVGLLGYYKLDGNANDELGVHNGVLNNIGFVSGGKIGGAMNNTNAGDPLQTDFNTGIYPKTTEAITLNLWYMSTTHTAGDYISCFDPDGATSCGGGANTNGDWTNYLGGGGGFMADWYDGSARRQATTPSGFTANGTWYMVTWVINSSTMTGYLNGVSGTPVASPGFTFTGTDFLMAWYGNNRMNKEDRMDEIGVWNRSLSTSEIQNLWNGGYGITYGVTSDMTVTQSYPADNLTSLNTTIPIGCNFLALGQNISSVKVNVTNSSGVQAYSDTNSTLPAGTNNTNYTWITTALGLGQYNWTCSGYGDQGINDTSSVRNFTIIPFLENSQTYLANTLIGSLNNFKINLTYDSVVYTYILGNLMYNNTEYAGTQIGSGDNIVFSVDIPSPFVTSTTNKSFYWNITTSAGTKTSQSHEQQISNITLDDCSTNTVLVYNFTIRDEESRLTYPYINGTLNVDLRLSTVGTTNELITYSHAFNSTSLKKICLSKNFTSYRVDMIADYQVTGYVTKFYYIDNGLLLNSSVPVGIDLHDLLATDSTTFLFEFTDENSLELPNAIVHTFRKYIGEGIFREVERSKQDNNGQTHVHLVEEDVIYYFMITQDGVFVYNSDQYNAKCLSVPCQLSLSASATAVNWTFINEGSKYEVSSNKATRVTTTKFSLEAVDLVNVSLYKMVDGQSVLINQSSLTSMAGSVSLVVPIVYGNNTFFVAIYRNNTFVKSSWIDMTEDGRNYFGTFGMILAGLIILCMMLMAVSEGIGFIIFTILGVLIVGLMELVEITPLALISIVCMGGVIIWKLVNRRGSQQ